jgi:hypothetical protein
VKRPHIALGCTQQGRTVPTLIQRTLDRAAAIVRTHLIDDDPKDVPPWEVAPPPELRLRQGWELEPIDPPHPWRLYALAFVAILTIFALSGCGGGGDDAPDATTQPPDCRARPELCA